MPRSIPWSHPVKLTSTAYPGRPASRSSGASGVPVHSAVPTASTSHGWPTGRGRSRARPLDRSAHVEPPGRRVHRRDVVVREQVVQAGRRDVVTKGLEGKAVVAGGELELVETDTLVGTGDPGRRAVRPDRRLLDRLLRDRQLRGHFAHPTATGAPTSD